MVIEQYSISRGLKYSDFFRDHLPQHSGDVRREFIFTDLKNRPSYIELHNRAEYRYKRIIRTLII